MKTCPRCLKPLVHDSVHTCTPTPYARGMEAKLERLRLIEAGARDSEALVEELHSQLDAQKEEAKLCRGMVSAQEAMIKNALEPLGCLPPFDHHAAEWAADQIGGLKAENTALKDLTLGVDWHKWHDALEILSALESHQELLTASRASAAALTAENAALSVQLEAVDVVLRRVGGINRMEALGALANREAALSARVQALEGALGSCAESLEFSLGLLGCPVQGNDGGSHGHDADSYGGIYALEDAHDALNSTPAADLAAHDLRVKREVVEKIALAGTHRINLNTLQDRQWLYRAAGIQPSTDTPTQEPK